MFIASIAGLSDRRKARVIVADVLVVATYRNGGGSVNDQRIIKIKAAHKAHFAAK